MHYLPVHVKIAVESDDGFVFCEMLSLPYTSLSPLGEKNFLTFATFSTHSCIVNPAVELDVNTEGKACNFHIAY